MSSEVLNFQGLVDAIEQTHSTLAIQAAKAVNISLTLRNWFIGHHIAEYQLSGADRANYGEGLLKELAQALQAQGISNAGRRQLYGYLNFYRAYPQMVRAASAQSALKLLPPSLRAISAPKKVRTVSAQSDLPAGLSNDQPPIGILLCTQKNHDMVQYALADMGNPLFVSNYQLQLPPTRDMEDFLRRALAELTPLGDAS